MRVCACEAVDASVCLECEEEAFLLTEHAIGHPLPSSIRTGVARKEMGVLEPKMVHWSVPFDRNPHDYYDIQAVKLMKSPPKEKHYILIKDLIQLLPTVHKFIFKLHSDL